MAYYYTRDQILSIHELCNSSGTIVSRLSYDPYGKMTVISGTNLPTKQFSGDYYHTTSGLNLTWYRGYDPSTGRWLARDPIGEDGGINLYGYVENSPIDNIDPLGLFVDPTGDASNAIFDALGGNSTAQKAAIVVVATVMGATSAGTIDALTMAMATRFPWLVPAAVAAKKVADGINGQPGECPASTPTGQSGSPMLVPRGTNSPAVINGLNYSGHALDEMQSDGLTPSVVQNTISQGAASAGNTPGTTVYYDAVNNVTVVTNASGGVITTYVVGRK